MSHLQLGAHSTSYIHIRARVRSNSASHSEPIVDSTHGSTYENGTYLSILTLDF